MIKKIRIVENQDRVRECAGCDSEQSNDWTHGHDHEGSMAKSEIKDLIKRAVELHNILGSNDKLPGWVSAYITLASDYINSVTQHLTGKAAEMGEMDDQMMAETKANEE